MKKWCMALISMLFLLQACQSQSNGSDWVIPPKEVLDILKKECKTSSWKRLPRSKAEKLGCDLRRQYTAHDAWPKGLYTAENNNKVSLFALESEKYYAVVWLYSLTDDYGTDYYFLCDCIDKEDGETVFAGVGSYNLDHKSYVF